jgi:hypothetical protein
MTTETNIHHYTRPVICAICKRDNAKYVIIYPELINVSPLCQGCHIAYRWGQSHGTGQQTLPIAEVNLWESINEPGAYIRFRSGPLGEKIETRKEPE